MTLSEYITQDIQLKINTPHNKIENTHCIITKQKDTFCLTYTLNKNDYLFDLQEKNYTLTIMIREQYFNKYSIPFSLHLERHSICC
ncbi:MAG: hypothetical protein ACRCR9_06945, partial [Chitinophagaceae bacterium]